MTQTTPQNLKLKNHRLTGDAYDPSKWIGKPITPEIVVVHDTAGRPEKGNSAHFLRTNKAKVSAHFVIEMDGTITQLVPTNRRANHAGKSEYHGKKWCNGFSIGIEIVNPGKMTKRGAAAQTWYGSNMDIAKLGIQEMTTPEHGHGLWLPYEAVQIDALLALLESLFDYIPTLTDIVPHWYVSPGRKTDTNPLFPMDHVKARIMGRDDPLEEELEATTEAVEDGTLTAVNTPNSGLCFRESPHTNPNVITEIPDGVVLPVQRRGEFNGYTWLQVLHGGRLGWVMEAFTRHFGGGATQ